MVWHVLIWSHICVSDRRELYTEYSGNWARILVILWLLTEEMKKWRMKVSSLGAIITMKVAREVTAIFDF